MNGSCCRTLLLLLLLLAAGDVLRPARAQATLRAPGAPQSDGRIIIGGTAINGKPAFLAQYESIFTDYLNAALGATLGKTFVTVRAGPERLLPPCIRIRHACLARLLSGPARVGGC
jgi:hypothetical protein